MAATTPTGAVMQRYADAGLTRSVGPAYRGDAPDGATAPYVAITQIHSDDAYTSTGDYRQVVRFQFSVFGKGGTPDAAYADAEARGETLRAAYLRRPDRDRMTFTGGVECRANAGMSRVMADPATDSRGNHVAHYACEFTFEFGRSLP